MTEKEAWGLLKKAVAECRKAGIKATWSPLYGVDNAIILVVEGVDWNGGKIRLCSTTQKKKEK